MAKRGETAVKKWSFRG